MNAHLLSDMTLSLLRYRRYHLSKEGYLLCLGITAVIAVSLFAYMAVKKSGLIKAMDFSGKAEYNEYKRG